MAYINGNKPIITNGLVYALDFGNLKSYTTGANTARSLVYDTAVTTVTGSSGLPTLVNGVLNITSSQFIRRTGSLDSIDPNGAFTISLVAKPNTVGSLLTQNLTGKVFQIQSTPSSSNIGFNLGTGTYSRTIPGFNSGSLQHISFRYNSGSIDTFLNGIPVTSSIANASLLPTGQLNALFFGSGSNSFSGSLANLYVYNRALSANEIYENYLVMAGRYGLPVVPKPYSIDENLYQWIQATSTTDTNTISAISTFISGLKSAGLWNKIQTIYPFVGTTTGSQTINLKEPGLYRLGLTGSFSASNAGLSPSSSTAFVDSIPGTTVHPLVNSASAHLSLLSYDTPAGNGFLGGNSLPAIGGDRIIASGSKMYHVFTNVGTSSFAMANPAIANVEVLVVGGGGSGGSGTGGGGGAGGLIYSSSYGIIPGTIYQVVVGNGGEAPPLMTAGKNGGNSVFSSLVAIGGGGGSSVGGPAGNGGSGGGGSTYTFNNSGSGTPGQGYDGDIGDPSDGGGGNGAGGGGGGAGAKGVLKNGGSGSYIASFAAIGGSPAGWFAGGGGGSTLSTSTGGIGGGGGGSISGPADGKSGSANTGGGGGSGWYHASGYGGAGGSGIVIVSYDFAPTSTALTGSGTGLYLTDSAITGSVNSQFTAGITGSGTIGFLTVSRTGSGVFSIHKNNVSQSVASASLGALSTDIFFNTANLAGSGSLPLQANLAYASIGAGLTTSEVATYYNLVSQFQTNLKRQNTLLDNYSGAAAAYSLRRIGPSGYFGPAIRVRRDSDNALRDIGFTSDGQLDTVGLLDFVGVTGSGFVQTWYDQSGNGRDASQATAGSQPLVISSGSIYTQTKYPSLYFNGTNNRFILSPTIPSQNTYSVFAVGFVNSTASGVDMIIGGTTNGSAGFRFGGGTPTGQITITRVNQVDTVTANITSGKQTLGTFLANNLKSEVFTDAILRGTGGIINPTAVIDMIGNAGSVLGQPYLGSMQEVVLYTTDQTSNRTAIESNINSNYKIYGDATASFDPDYQSFITATGITQPTQSAALETLVSDLKSYGLWNKMKAIYPMITDKNNRFAYSEEFDNGQWNKVGTVVATNNVTAPDGTLTAERLTETISSITTYTVTANGSSNYIINGESNPTLNLEKGKIYNFDINAAGHPFYIQTVSGVYSPANVYNTGVTNNGASTGTVTIQVAQDTPQLYYACGSSHASMVGSLNIINNTDTHHIYQTIDSLISGNEYVASIYGRFNNRPWIAIETNAGARAWFNIQTGVTGSLTGSNSTISAVSGGWYRCALYFTSSVASGPQNIQYHLADADNNLTYTGVSGTGSYMWGAQFENGNVLGPYRATTTVGFTTGSMLDQMKYNLKNTGSFSGSYVGGWNPGYGGNRPNGVNGYMDTNFNPNGQITSTNSHLSFYQANTFNSGDQLHGIISTQRFFIDLYGVNELYAALGTSESNSTTSLNKNAMHILNALNSTAKIFRNTTELTTWTSSGAMPNLNVYFGAANDGFGGIYFNASKLGFSSIGDGLTDYEAKALYWIVQKYQTTLGRQVY